MNATDIAKTKDILTQASSILIVTHNYPSYDSIGASLSVYLGLLSLEKNVTVASASPMTVEFSSFVGADKLQTQVKKGNFVVSLDYQEGSIDKVSYNIAGNKFNLVIEQRPGFTGFSEKNVSYSQSCLTADAILVIDTEKLEDLGALYTENSTLFEQKPVIAIQRKQPQELYATVHIADEESCCVTETVAVLLSSLGVKLTTDIATNIVNGIYGATDSFRMESVTPRAFEVASVCLKSGGKRFSIFESGKTQNMQKPASSIQPSLIDPQHVEPTGEHVQSTDNAQASQITPPTQQPAPDDWLKPKIFKSSQTTSRA